MNRRHALVVVAITLTVLTLAACTAGPNAAAGAPESAGFWLGLWHGFISPFTFIVSLFNAEVGVYEVTNNGGWYNFGFLVGASAIFGGGGGAAGRRR